MTARAKPKPAEQSVWEDAIIETREIALDQVTFHPLNPSIHTEFLQGLVKGSLDAHGWVRRPIYNERTGHVIDGHARLKVAMREGVTSLLFDVVDKSEDDENALLGVLDEMVKLKGHDPTTRAKLLDGLQERHSGAMASFLGQLKSESDERVAALASLGRSSEEPGGAQSSGGEPGGGEDPGDDLVEIRVQVTADQKVLMQAAADAEGVSLPFWLRQHALAAIEE